MADGTDLSDRGRVPEEGPAPAGSVAHGGRRARMSGSARTIWIMALVAVVSLGIGIVASNLIVSPGEAAARAAPPVPGAITVPVERRELANDIVMRGDVVYEDPVEVVVETGDLGGPAIVTGGVPEVGATIEPASVLLEVTGRPVIALTGELPVYRTLRGGVSGPDVVQLQEALAAADLYAGEADGVYGAATAAAVALLYDRVGYPAPGPGEEVEAQVQAAREMLDAAEDSLRLADADLRAAHSEVPHAERVRLQAAVRTAAAQLDEARAACAAEPAVCRPSDVTAAEGALATAVAERDGADTPPDTSTQRAAVSAAQEALARAREDLTSAQAGAITPLPASEVVYLSSMPRRVDLVAVDRGSVLSGTSAMSVSGAELQIRANISDTDASLLEVGTSATLSLPDDTEVGATVTQVGGEDPGTGDAASDAGRTAVIITPGDLTEEQRAAIQGSNVRVVVPVSATDGEVLAVPLAALTAGPGGESRVEVVDGEGTRLVEVATGLAAEGFVEVTAVGEELTEEDRVVVGQADGAEPETDDTAEDE
ncbi:peptidoglycan-binding protein [Georgenia wangjunii]|uniref:peptidoglycan-binding protein n=1 Tax=Georgenia wangjunii TaxID=3117730 RepID=UPI002F2670E7